MDKNEQTTMSNKCYFTSIMCGASESSMVFKLLTTERVAQIAANNENSVQSRIILYWGIYILNPIV